MLEALSLTIPSEFVLTRRYVDKIRTFINNNEPDRVRERTRTWFMSQFAIKRGYYEGLESRRRNYVREAVVSQDLEWCNVNVPHVYGLNFGPADQLLAMSRIEYPDGIFSPFDYQDVKSRFEEQISRAEKAGYGVQDSSPENNCGVGKDGRVYLFDFELWDAPRRITNRLKALNCI